MRSRKESILKTKTVKRCICGREPKATFEWTDRDQAFTILLVLAIAGFTIGSIGLGTINDVGDWEDTDITKLLFLGTFAYFIYLVWKRKKARHSLKCALRLALYRV